MSDESSETKVISEFNINSLIDEYLLLIVVVAIFGVVGGLGRRCCLPFRLESVHRRRRVIGDDR